jgi:hypothetical protein
MAFDPVAMFHVLDEHDVRYVVIGGIAAAAHGSPTLTGDLDICYDRAEENLDALAAALRELGARLRGVEDEVPFQLDRATLAAGDHFTFTTRVGDFDCMATPAGVEGYGDLSANAVAVDLDGLTVSMASVDDLIRMKNATGRPKDRVEVEILGALRDELGD